MDILNQYAGQAVGLVIAVLAVTALVNSVANLPTRWKPALTALVGILLGVLLWLRQGQPWYDGSAVGFIASLIAMELWQRGKFDEAKPVTSTLTQTTTLTTPPEPVPPERPQ